MVAQIDYLIACNMLFSRWIMLLGFLWLFVDFCVSIARLFSLQLLSDHTHLYFLTKLEPGDPL